MPSTADVTDESQVNEMVRQATDRYGRIDVLFNNAGAMVLGESIMEIDAARWDQVMRTNATGPYHCSRAVLPVMMEQQRGSVINLGSRMATDPKQGGGVLYSASKAAVHMFSLCLADEVRDCNIAVNILSSGPLRSEGSAAIPWTHRDWHLRVDPSEVRPQRRVPVPAGRPHLYRPARGPLRLSAQLGGRTSRVPPPATGSPPGINRALRAVPAPCHCPRVTLAVLPRPPGCV